MMNLSGDNGRVNAIPIHAFNPGPITGAGNWTWLIPGRVPTLIDAGTGDPRHLDAVADALRGSRDLKVSGYHPRLAQVIVTHSHSDHAAGAQAIAERFPGVRFLKMPWPDRDPKWGVTWSAIGDGDAVPAGDTALTAVHTPGHAPDHLCLWHQESRTLFGGDLAVKGTTVWIPTSLQGDLTDYLASLERVLLLAPARLLPAHGDVIDEPDALLRGYLSHRREREQQVLAALREGNVNPDSIVEHIYRGLKERLIPMAKESVLAQLLKLEREGRVRRDGEAWHMIDA
jgi:glyoxylase-like metal-dependent hydrolase (beta-lactamase superfamily II)